MHWVFVAPGLEVSDAGLVRRDTIDEPFLPAANACGYRAIFVQGKRTMLHTLVATAFIGPAPSAFHTVDHINRDRGDNRINNLRWATKTEQGKNQNVVSGDVHLLCTPIEFRKIGTQQWLLAPSVNSAAKLSGVHQSNISTCLSCSTSGSFCKGFEFRKQAAEELDGEVWKQIEQFSCTSYVSNLGRIKHSKSSAFTPKPRGLMEYAMFKHVPVHRLVAFAFLGQPPSADHTVDHINRDRADNRVANLRWASRVEQRANQTRGNQKITKKRRVATQIDGSIRIFVSAQEAERATGAQAQNIQKVCAGKRKVAGGLKWWYA